MNAETLETVDKYLGATLKIDGTSEKEIGLAKNKIGDSNFGSG